MSSSGNSLLWISSDINWPIPSWRSRLTWPCWRHQMETFSALLALCAGNSSVPGEFHAQRPVTRSFNVFFDLRLNKRLSKQSWGWGLETLSRPLWRHCNGDCTLTQNSNNHHALPTVITSLVRVVCAAVEKYLSTRICNFLTKERSVSFDYPLISSRRSQWYSKSLMI